MKRKQYYASKIFNSLLTDKCIYQKLKSKNHMYVRYYTRHKLIEINDKYD